MSSCNKLYNTANKIRMKLLLFIDNEIQKKSKKSKNINTYIKNEIKSHSNQIYLEETFTESYRTQFYFSFTQENCQSCLKKKATICNNSLNLSDVILGKCKKRKYITKTNTNFFSIEAKANEKFRKNDSNIIVNKNRILNKKEKNIGRDYLLQLCHSLKLKNIRYKYFNKNKNHTHAIKKYLNKQNGKGKFQHMIFCSPETSKTKTNKKGICNLTNETKNKTKLSVIHLVSMLD